MNTLAAGLRLSVPSEVAFDATVSSSPRYFYGRATHALHETFRCRSDDGHALEIVDNVKLAARLPVERGDRISVQGELVPYARRGALVHWTHHDPQHVHPDGYIDFNGRRYA